MLDKEGRVLIPIEIMGEELATKTRKVYFYYSTEQNRFYLMFEKESRGYFIGEGDLDIYNKVKLPELIKEAYNTDQIFCAQKYDRIYLISLKKD